MGLGSRSVAVKAWRIRIYTYPRGCCIGSNDAITAFKRGESFS